MNLAARSGNTIGELRRKRENAGRAASRRRVYYGAIVYGKEKRNGQTETVQLYVIRWTRVKRGGEGRAPVIEDTNYRKTATVCWPFAARYVGRRGAFPVTRRKEKGEKERERDKYPIKGNGRILLRYLIIEYVRRIDENGREALRPFNITRIVMTQSRGPGNWPRVYRGCISSS